MTTSTNFDYIKVRGLFAMLDILGFSEYNVNHSLEETLKIIELLQSIVSKNLTNSNEYALYCEDINIRDEGYESRHANFDYALFADTIVIYQIERSPYYGSPEFQLCTLSSMISDILTNSFENGILLRGAISHGDYLVKRDPIVLIGKPVSRAHSLCNIQEWSGVIIDHDLLKPKSLDETWNPCFANHKHFKFLQPELRPYKIPLKTGITELCWTINWQSNKKIFEKLYKQAPDFAKSKIHNTMQYHDFSSFI